MAYRDDKARHRRHLELLHGARPSSACPVRWEQMVAAGRARRCSLCHRGVYDVSELEPAAAVALVSETEGREVRALYRRHDATLITGDCPWGSHRRRVRRAVGAFAAFLLTATFAAALSPHTPPCGQRIAAPVMRAQIEHASIPPHLDRRLGRDDG